MQKKIIALAVAALASSAAFAQSNVTVYGVADVGQAFVKSSDGTVPNSGQASVGRLDSNSSYIGFKGVEDLGNGLKAVFQFETTVAADAGGFSTGRDTYVGLAGGFGTVVAGNLTHPLRAFGAKAEIMPGAAGIGTMASLLGTIGGIKTGADDRAANAIAYVSPSFSGFTVIGAYVNGEKKQTAAQNAGLAYNKRAWQLAGQYDNGPLFAGLGYHSAKDSGDNWTITNQEADARIIRGVVSYTLPTATKLAAIYDNTKVKNITGLITANDELKRQAFGLSVAQTFGKNTVGAEYAQSMKVKANGSGLVGTDKKMFSLLYTYEMSKRTMLHARYSKLFNKDDSASVGAALGTTLNADFYLNGVGATNLTGAGSDVSGIMVGLRHSF